MALKNILIVMCLIVVSHVSARILDQCQIARELVAHGLPRNQMNDWVCLVQRESLGNTAAIGDMNWDHSKDHGLFQINDRYWCENGRPGKECNVDCNALRSDDISAAVTCAKLVFSRHGFDGWVAWKNYCSGGRAPSVDHCF